MKFLKSLIILLVIVIIVGLILPMDLRSGYFNYSLGRISELTGKTGQAVERYGFATGAMPDSVLFARAYLRALNDLGEMRDNDDDFSTALAYADKWIDEHEGDFDAWQIWIEKARAEWGKGVKNAGKVSIDKAVSLNPTDYTALVYQGIIYRDYRPNIKNEVRLSIPIFQQAIELRHYTRTYWAHIELAKAFKMVNDETGAIVELNQCLSQYPPRKVKMEAERLKNEIQSSGRSER